MGRLTALNRPHELKLHVHAAHNNGLAKEEMGEVLLQTAAYCGIAAAKDSFSSRDEG
jgi:4-carboxymuconolactone decarboxylase